MAGTGNERKKVIWEFANSRVKVSDKSTKADNEKQFEFALTCYKDSDTHEENIKVLCYKNGVENGFIITTPCSLDKDLMDLKRYGVMFSPIVFRDLRKVIEENYFDITVETVDVSKDDGRLWELLNCVREFVEGNSDLVKVDCCYILATQFNDLAEECGYYPYEFRSLREHLAHNKYIRTQNKRYTVPHRIGSKTERTIAFFKEKLIASVPTKKSDQVKASGTDEK